MSLQWQHDIYGMLVAAQGAAAASVAGTEVVEDITAADAAACLIGSAQALHCLELRLHVHAAFTQLTSCLPCIERCIAASVLLPSLILVSFLSSTS